MVKLKETKNNAKQFINNCQLNLRSLSSTIGLFEASELYMTSFFKTFLDENEFLSCKRWLFTSLTFPAKLNVLS